MVDPETPRPTILVLDPIDAGAIRLMSETARVVEPPESARFARADAAALIVRTARVTAEDMDRSPGLKVIGKHGVGVDAIDCEAARARGIRVVNTPGTNVNAVVELTLALALAVAREIPAADRALRAGTPVPRRSGIEWSGRTAGVIGLGRIGATVGHRLAHGLGMRVLGFSPNRRVNDPAITQVDDLDELLSQCELVTLHVPLAPLTRGLIDARRLGLMPRGAALINLARGGVVDEDALAAALRSGHLRGAASDVFAVEPPPSTHPLLRCDNFIATPHLGAETDEALAATGAAVARGVLDALAGIEPEFAVV